MRIYVGRWDLLPEEWGGINGLNEKLESEIKREIARQLYITLREEGIADKLVACYTPREFEETFNQCTEEILCSDVYFIRIF